MPIRILIFGRNGQVAQELARIPWPRSVELTQAGRAECDLGVPGAAERFITARRPDIIINAAAYTAVDLAEKEVEAARRLNAEAPAEIALAAAACGSKLIHLSTDYVFDGRLDRPYREDDATAPTGAYGRSKLEGERQVAARAPNSAILRTAWVYSPFGMNFVRTMLRLSETREEIGVVADQRGNPTSALDIADALIKIARRLTADASQDLRGVFHMTGAGEATWADFAEAIFAAAERHGRKPVRVRRIATADYPTPARRPANSRLDCGKLARAYGVALPDWRASLEDCVARLLSTT